jgi:sigma-B regulation protein RsbU (phosphoserine phosphatase)
MPHRRPLSLTPPPADVVQTLVRRLSESMRISTGVLYLEKGEEYAAVCAWHDLPLPDLCFPLVCDFVDRLRQAGGPLAVRFAELDIEEIRQLSGVNPQLLLPLCAEQRLPGFLALGPKYYHEPYSDAELRQLSSFARQAALALEGSLLEAELETEIAQREEIEVELASAREVQERLFPRELPRIAGLDCAAMWRPARDVGGDYYDFLSLPNGGLAFVIGDVSGKGLAAALLMAGLRALVRGQLLKTGAAMEDVLATINHVFHEASPVNCFVTLFFAQYNPSSKRLRFINAGHDAPFIVRGAEVIELAAGNPVIGVFADPIFSASEIDLAPGDTLVAYTDGITEAMDYRNAEWGKDRLIEIARNSAHLNSSALISRIIHSVDSFTTDSGQHDDITLLALKMRPTGAVC